ncbi:hypothetical protein M513_11066 [Trichuris suis]|uniref:Uncharacterized protein n=1 Tax=Trichuris suis TaxID=68888 RepID=A0A085LSV0_9BILA|nr:hypothetical protein M513_11066 [Trichuris suis]
MMKLFNQYQKVQEEPDEQADRQVEEFIKLLLYDKAFHAWKLRWDGWTGRNSLIRNGCYV